MSRPWCVGEMTTAIANNINIVVCHCSDYIPFTDAILDNMTMLFGAGGSALMENEITVEEAREALRQIRDDEKAIK